MTLVITPFDHDASEPGDDAVVAQGQLGGTLAAAQTSIFDDDWGVPATLVVALMVHVNREVIEQEVATYKETFPGSNEYALVPGQVWTEQAHLVMEHPTLAGWVHHGVWTVQLGPSDVAPSFVLIDWYKDGVEGVDTMSSWSFVVLDLSITDNSDLSVPPTRLNAPVVGTPVTNPVSGNEITMAEQRRWLRWMVTTPSAFNDSSFLLDGAGHHWSVSAWNGFSVLSPFHQSFRTEADLFFPNLDPETGLILPPAQVSTLEIFIPFDLAVRTARFRHRQRDDDFRAGGLARNHPTSQQASIRQGPTAYR